MNSPIGVTAELDKAGAVWQSIAGALLESRLVMQKSLCAITAAAILALSLSGSAANAGAYPFGDEPYRLNWGYDAAVESGCLKWNWQQYQWNDACPVYIHPKAYMHPRATHVVFPPPKDWFAY
jgi:hypothetical protein